MATRSATPPIGLAALLWCQSGARNAATRDLALENSRVAKLLGDSTARLVEEASAPQAPHRSRDALGARAGARNRVAPLLGDRRRPIPSSAFVAARGFLPSEIPRLSASRDVP
jgi:hypothetical protein